MVLINVARSSRTRSIRQQRKVLRRIFIAAGEERKRGNGWMRFIRNVRYPKAYKIYLYMLYTSRICILVVRRYIRARIDGFSSWSAARTHILLFAYVVDRSRHMYVHVVGVVMFILNVFSTRGDSRISFEWRSACWHRRPQVNVYIDRDSSSVSTRRAKFIYYNVVTIVSQLSEILEA